MTPVTRRVRKTRGPHTWQCEQCTKVQNTMAAGKQAKVKVWNWSHKRNQFGKGGRDPHRVGKNFWSEDERKKERTGQEKGGAMTADCAGRVVRKDTSQHSARRIGEKSLIALDESEEGAVEDLQENDEELHAWCILKKVKVHSGKKSSANRARRKRSDENQSDNGHWSCKSRHTQNVASQREAGTQRRATENCCSEWIPNSETVRSDNTIQEE